MSSINNNNRTQLILNLALAGFFTIVFVVLVIVVLRSQDNEMRNKSDQQMNDAIKNLKYRVDNESQINQEKVAESLRLFVYFMRQSGQITQENDSIGRQTTNFITGETSYIRVPRWTVRGKDINTLNPVIENVYSLTGAQSALYQKTPEGFLIMASNFDYSDRELLTDIYIPTTTDVVSTIENGEIYSGNLTVLKKQFVTSFFPLFLNSKISGMISCMKRFEISKQTTDYIKNTMFNSSGYLFMISKSSGILIHPEFANAESLHAERIYNKIRTADTSKSIVTTIYKMPEKGYDVCQKTLYVKEYDSYLGVCCPVSELGISFSRKMKVVAIFFVMWLITMFVLFITNATFFKLFNSISHFVFQIAEGKKMETRVSKIVSKLNPNEFVTMERMVDSVIDNQHKRIDCIKQLQTGDYETSLNITPGRDYEADLLIELREKLVEREQKGKIQKLDIEHNDWINNGISTFIEILRFQGQERKVLAYNIISNLVKYVGAIQGAIYFTNEDDPENIKLDLSACYAYEKQKLLELSLPVDEGLLGRAYHESRVINITDLPPGYMRIVSGLGDAQPNNLIIVPLIFNQKISGMLELASFSYFEEYQVTFLTRIAESIASAISGLKISERTENLLQRSQEQSKLMKIQEVEMRRNLQEMRRLKEEAESKDSEMRGLFRAVDATSLVTQYDKDGTIVHVNTRVIDLMQMPEEDLLGKNHAEISSFNPEDKNYRKFWEDLRHGQTRSLVESISTPQQKKIWISETFSPITDDRGNVMKIINIGMNITETKILEQQLRRQEKEINRQMDKLEEKEKEMNEKQHYIEDREIQMKSFNAAIDSFIIKIEFSRRGVIISANSLFFNTLNLDDSEVINHDLVEFLTSEYISPFNTALTILCSGREQIIKLKFATAGKTILVNSNLFPTVNTKGDVEKILMLGTIISE